MGAQPSSSIGLTIGVPTFNRRNSLCELMRSIGGAVPVLVVNDGSTDGTAEALAAFPDVDVVHHPSNRGYASALVTLFEACRTDYLLVSADDDLVRPAEVLRLIRWLDQHRPDLVSTSWLTGDGRDYREVPGIRAIRPSEVRRATGHAPGIAYRLDAVTRAVGLLKERIDSGDEAALVYPQVLVAFALSASGADCKWWTGSPVVEGSSLPSGIGSTAGTAYSTPQARYLQIRSYLDFLGRIEGGETLRRIQARKFHSQVIASLPPAAQQDINDVAAERLIASSPGRIWRLLRLSLRHGGRALLLRAIGRI